MSDKPKVKVPKCIGPEVPTYPPKEIPKEIRNPNAMNIKSNDGCIGRDHLEHVFRFIYI